MPAGRPPKGLDLVDELESSPESKERLKVILETVSGGISVGQACERLGVSETRFYQMREEALVGAVIGLQPKPRGRPRKQVEVGEDEIEALKRENAELREELEFARARTVLATAFPHLVKDPADQKKNGSQEGEAEKAQGGACPEEEERLKVPSRESRRQEKFEERMEAAVAVKESRRERSRRRRPKRRGIVGQKERRENERTVRSMAVVMLRWALAHGKTLKDAAERLLMSPRTLKDWLKKWVKGKMEVKAVGRKPDRGERWKRDLAFALFDLLGPGTGIPTFRSLLPEMSRAELEEIKERYVRIYKSKKKITYHMLRWTRPGAIWAMDHTWAPMAVDGVFDLLLLVRDLASRDILSSLPVETDDSATVISLLRALFAWHWKPLVIKSDNGSAFTAQDVRDFLRENGVHLLLSPPETPQFNGSCEAGCGSVKSYAFHEAARNDRPHAWTPDDVEAGRCRSNIIPRQDDPRERTPDEIFEASEPVSDGERAAFNFAYLHNVEEVRTELEIEPGKILSTKEQDRVDRLALSRALVEEGFLFFRRRRITPVISRRKFAKISQG